MQDAIMLAKRAESAGDVPIGAIVVDADNNIIGRGWNQREIPPFDPSAHAEVVALREAAATKGTWRLDDCTLVVTLEPCAMCAGAIVLSRIKRLVFGAWDPKAGACGSLRDIVRDDRLNHQIEVIAGVRADETGQLLRNFFGRTD